MLERTPLERRSYVATIVVGAGRSGTNMLRDALARLPGAGTWPCDEINAVWRHGNARHPDDELTPAMAGPRTRRYVRRAFERLAARRKLSHVIEKTCANSLRVRFVHRIFPEARFVFLVRDGRDVTASAMERWRAPLDLPYVLRKARFVPLGDVPHYALRFLATRAHRLLSTERRVRSWGPRFAGMDDAARTDSLAELCARQWVRCVEKAEEELATIPQEQVYRLRYEDYVCGPGPFLRELAEFLGIPADDVALAPGSGGVTADSVGRWRQRLTPEQQRAIGPIVASTLARHGYVP